MKPYEIRFLTLLLIAQLFVVGVPVFSSALVSLSAGPEDSLRLMKLFRTASTILGQLPSMIICGLWLRRKELDREGNHVLWFFAGILFSIQGLLLYFGIRILSDIRAKQIEK